MTTTTKSKREQKTAIKGVKRRKKHSVSPRKLVQKMQYSAIKTM